MASSLARLGAALPRGRLLAAAAVAAAHIPPRGGRWDSAAASRPASLYAWRCQVHSDVKASPAAEPKDGGNSSQNWRIKMLYDGECPLCMREVNMLRERNKSYGAINFVDISSKDYSPEENQGLDYETAMGRIHAIVSDRTIVTDVEVATIANAVYGVWAKYRMEVTGLATKSLANVKMINHARCEQQITHLLHSTYSYFSICLDRHIYIRS
ncbi:hypothetical protein ACQ4PT_050018 [Festuca glaucescens]